MLAINHLAWIDIPVVGAQSPRNINFVTKMEMREVPGFGAFLNWHGIISVRRGESDRDAVRTMVDFARAGRVIGVFVEGTRQKATGRPGHAQPGAAMVAIQAGVPVVPIAVYGTQFWKGWNFAPCSIAARRAVPARRVPEGRQGLQGGERRDRAADQRPLRLARRRARARPPARTWCPRCERRTRSSKSTPTCSSTDLLGTVAIVGYPNVGKSTLINRLTSTRAAVVHETSGTTRDRKELVCDWAGKRFLLIDTGGVDIASKDAVARSIVDQARVAVAEADLVLFVVDARAGVTAGDEELATILRLSNKPVLVLANKIDDPAQESLALELHRLGLGDPLPISGMHGTGTGDLLDEIVGRLEDVGESRPAVTDEAIRVAILGRPNVGKSSLFNALIGEERTIVSEVPGTTRDSIDTLLVRDGQAFQLVDTAGLRRKRKQRQGIEYYSELRALEAAERADVALVLIDASEGIVEGDLQAADVARKAQCSTLIVLSKWDLSTVTIEDVRPELLRRLRQRPPIVTTSAKTGRGIARVLDKIAELFVKHSGRIGTGELNRFLGELKEARQPPSKGRKHLNLLYGAQVSTRPPRFRFTVNDTSLVTRDYAYWVENELRARYAMEGIPVAIDFRRRS